MLMPKQEEEVHGKQRELDRLKDEEKELTTDIKKSEREIQRIEDDLKVVQELEEEVSLLLLCLSTPCVCVQCMRGTAWRFAILRCRNARNFCKPECRTWTNCLTQKAITPVSRRSFFKLAAGDQSHVAIYWTNLAWKQNCRGNYDSLNSVEKESMTRMAPQWEHFRNWKKDIIPPCVRVGSARVRRTRSVRKRNTKFPLSSSVFHELGFTVMVLSVNIFCLSLKFHFHMCVKHFV